MKNLLADWIKRYKAYREATFNTIVVNDSPDSFDTPSIAGDLHIRILSQEEQDIDEAEHKDPDEE